MADVLISVPGARPLERADDAAAAADANDATAVVDTVANEPETLSAAGVSLVWIGVALFLAFSTGYGCYIALRMSGVSAFWSLLAGCWMTAFTKVVVTAVLPRGR